MEKRRIFYRFLVAMETNLFKMAEYYLNFLKNINFYILASKMISNSATDPSEDKNTQISVKYPIFSNQFSIQDMLT